MVVTDHAAAHHIFQNTDDYGELWLSSRSSGVYGAVATDHCSTHEPDLTVWLMLMLMQLHIVKSPAFRPPVANVLGKGVVWAEGDDHKKQRRVLAPAFS